MSVNMHGNMPDVNTKLIGVSLPLELVARIDRAAKEDGATRSEIVRRAVEQSVRDVRLTDEDLAWIAQRRRENAGRRETRRMMAAKSGPVSGRIGGLG